MVAAKNRASPWVSLPPPVSRLPQFAASTATLLSDAGTHRRRPGKVRYVTLEGLVTLGPCEEWVLWNVFASMVNEKGRETKDQR